LGAGPETVRAARRVGEELEDLVRQRRRPRLAVLLADVEVDEAVRNVLVIRRVVAERPLDARRRIL
jgi:hypothetical protein